MDIRTINVIAVYTLGAYKALTVRSELDLIYNTSHFPFLIPWRPAEPTDEATKGVYGLGGGCYFQRGQEALTLGAMRKIPVRLLRV